MYRFLKPILVSLTCWLVLPLTPDVRCMDQEKIIDTMNELLVNPGWVLMNVRVKGTTTNSVLHSGILCESVGQNPAVTKDNVYEKLRLMSIVLSCKYAEISLSYVEAIRLFLVECLQKTTTIQAKWICYWAIMVKIENIKPLLLNMENAVQRVNHMDVDLTVPKFEHDLSTFIRNMNDLYEKHGCLKQPLPHTDITPDLLDKMYTSFMTVFAEYSVSMIGFLDRFCHAQIVPNKETFVSHYIKSKPSFKKPMDLCDFLSSEIDNSIQKNIQLFYASLGF